MLQWQISGFGVRWDQHFPSVNHHLFMYKMRVVRDASVRGKLESIKETSLHSVHPSDGRNEEFASQEPMERLCSSY